MPEKKIWERVLGSEEKILQGGDKTSRMEVPGGWVIRYEIFKGEGRSTSNTCYFPDHTHQWEPDISDDWEVCYHRRSPNDNQITCRLRVPEGWIVRDGYYVRWKHLSISLVFVPDKEHNWSLPDKETG